MSQPRSDQKKNRFWLVVGLVVAIVGAGVWTWEQVLEDRLIAKRFGVVKPAAIYRSGQLSQHVVADVLKEHQVDVVIDMTGPQPDNPDQLAELRAVKTLGIDHEKFPLHGDGTGYPQQYVFALERLIRARQAGQRVLVHCAAGSQRAGGMTALYRLLVEGASPRRIIRELKRYDWSPHDDRVLLEYLDTHLPYIAGELYARGLIDELPDPMPKLTAALD